MTNGDQFPKSIRLAPKPFAVAGLREPVVSLDGVWEYRAGDDLAALAQDRDQSGWKAVTVPSFMNANRRVGPGGAGRYAYRREIALAEEWAEHALYLRFKSVNGFCEIFIDGVSAGRHENGFLAFGLDITPFVRGKKSAVLTVTVDEQSDTVSTFSVGGIMRGVALYVLPKVYVSMLRAVPAFDSQFRHATLTIAYALSGLAGAATLTARLLDPMGAVAAEKTLQPVHPDGFCGDDSLSVCDPLPWDAEHPWLYTLCLRLESGGQIAQEVRLRVGLRQIHRAGSRLYVNGQEVKLRGVCRHEVSALHGRCLTPELIQKDVALFREANCNYIRTSHYPPSEYFLDLCDEAGLYVEDELPLAFIARTLPYTQRDPAQTQRYLSVFNELYARDASHPSVLMWSLCNESFGGYNFDLLNRYAQQLDKTRPTKFSYPMTMPQEHAPVDIWSVHYANWDDDLAAKRDNVSVAGAPGKDMPVIHDEYAHVPCYNRTEHRRDPHVQDLLGRRPRQILELHLEYAGRAGRGDLGGDRRNGPLHGRRNAAGMGHHRHLAAAQARALYDPEGIFAGRSRAGAGRGFCVRPRGKPVLPYQPYGGYGCVALRERQQLAARAGRGAARNGAAAAARCPRARRNAPAGFLRRLS